MEPVDFLWSLMASSKVRSFQLWLLKSAPRLLTLQKARDYTTNLMGSSYREIIHEWKKYPEIIPLCMLSPPKKNCHEKGHWQRKTPDVVLHWSIGHHHSSNAGEEDILGTGEKTGKLTDFWCLDLIDSRCCCLHPSFSWCCLKTLAAYHHFFFASIPSVDLRCYPLVN